MDSAILTILANANKNDESFIQATICLEKLIVKKLSNDEIKAIFSIAHKLHIGTFLQEYQYFDENDLKYIEQYILDNLNDEDKLFVSDLIEFATYWEFQLPYQECIDLLTIYENENAYVQLAVIDYIFENLKFPYIQEIITSFQTILNHKEMENSVKIKAAFAMFRITMKQEYMDDLIDLVVTEGYDKLLDNILDMKYNSQKYFDYHDLFKSIIQAREAKNNSD